MMNWKQFFSSIFLFSLLSIASALDFSVETHYDTFDRTKETGTVGFSFTLQEQLTNTTFIDANLLYKNAGQYAAYCTGNVETGFLALGGGVIYDIYNQVITPGLVADMKMKLGKAVLIGGSYFITFTPENIFKDYAQEASVFWRTQLINTYLTSKYEYRHVKINDLKRFSHGANFSILAYDMNSPINLGLNSTIKLYFDEADSKYFDFTIDAGASFEFDTKKFGAYFIKAGANVFTFTAATQKVPFSISIGARFIAE